MNVSNQAPVAARSVPRRPRQAAISPVGAPAHGLRLPIAADAPPETTGRRTRLARRTAACNGLEGDTLRTTARRGHDADRVRNDQVGFVRRRPCTATSTAPHANPRTIPVGLDSE